MTGPSRLRPAWVQVDVAAIRHNAEVLAQLAAPAALCAVVKADGYGHGALAVARAAVEGGARWLAVATVDEGVALRDGGLSVPVLLLSEPPAPAMDEAWTRRLTPSLYSAAGVEAARRAVRRSPGAGAGATWAVQLKVDTGMHRVGCDVGELADMAAAVSRAEELRLAGVWTHLAVADGSGADDRAFTAEQLARFDAALQALRRSGTEVPLCHAANSAGAMVHPAARLQLVRCGIALYGLAPCPDLSADAARLGLRPALTWKAQVSHVRSLPAGARPSYGRARPLPGPATVAVVPLGYADGVPRSWFAAGGTVIVGGAERPLAGVVTMDQIIVDCGPDDGVRVGDEAVLIGGQGRAHLTAWDWAGRLGTIAYEVVCGIGTRVPRLVVDTDRSPTATTQEV